jgi:hypothetical protein
MAKLFSLPGRAEARRAGTQSRPLALPRQAYSSMRDNSRSLIGSEGNVVRFRPRGTAPPHELRLRSCDTTGECPVEKLRAYEHAPESDDDYGRRMLANFAATIVLIVLVVTGSWMVDMIIKSWP